MLEHDSAARWELVWIAGPDAGAVTRLAAGTYVVGRSPVADVHCDDLTLQPFHLELTLAAGEALAWTQLAGRTPVREGDGWLDLGSSRLTIRPVAGAIATHATRTAAGGGLVHRTPRAVPSTAVEPVVVPEPLQHARAAVSMGSATGTIAPALLALGAGLLVAVVVGQPMFALIGLMGALVAVGTWVVGRVRDRRQRRRHGEVLRVARQQLDHDIADRADELVGRLRRAQPGLVGALALLHQAPLGLWQRRAAHGDVNDVVFGLGTRSWDPAIEGQPPVPLVDVPVVVDLGPRARLAVDGRDAAALVRSAIVQLAVTTGPADWQLLVVSETPRRWEWAATLPHLVRTNEGAVTFDEAALAELLAEPATLSGRHLVVVTDGPDALAMRTGSLRRVLHVLADAALVVEMSGEARTVPALCRSVVTTTSDGRARFVVDAAVDDEPVAMRIAGLGERRAARAAAALAGWIDPEAPDHGERAMPATIELGELLDRRGLDRRSIADRWRCVGPDARPSTPIGVAADGVIELDLVRDGPHGLIAGTTGSGKSELLRTLVLGTCAGAGPDQVSFVLVDFKGGATFDGLGDLPHVAGVVTDLDHHLAERMLRGLQAEVVDRERVLRAHGRPDLGSLRALLGVPAMARLVVIVDEFAALAVEHPDLLHSLVDVARRGRSLGVHLLLATQRPSGVVSDEIRTNTDLRIALRVLDAADAVDVIGDSAAAAIRRSTPGRAVMRLGPTELVTFQSACCLDSTALVDEIRAAAAETGLVPVARLWCEPLPAVLGDDRLASFGAGALGLLDHPDRRCQAPLHWQPSDGNLLVVGSRGSGVTTALASAAVRTLADDAELLVIDALVDHRWDEVATHPRCGGVVRVHEREALTRTFRRALSAPPSGGRVVVVDGIAALRRELEPAPRLVDHDALDVLLATPPLGVVVVIGNDGVAGLGPGLMARCPYRWLLHLHDGGDGAALGVRAAEMPPRIPGRMLDVASGSAAQLLGWPEWTNTAPQVVRMGVLPETVPADAMPASTHDGHRWSAVIGRCADTLQPALLDVADGDHLLVVGPPRSGRSGVLARLIECWTEASDDAAVVVIAPSRSPLSGLAADGLAGAVERARHSATEGRPTLLVVDDAETVRDDAGRLLALVAEPPDGLVVVAAGRGDGLRGGAGTWAGAIRRSRRGVVMAGAHDSDADLLAVSLPRHPPIAPRPGLCWLVGDAEPRMVQTALSVAAGPRRVEETTSYRGGR